MKPSAIFIMNLIGGKELIFAFTRGLSALPIPHTIAHRYRLRLKCDR
jgi:hypothetical protein